MGDRKRPGRFTIQFNQQDPQQRMVTKILEEKGRRKAQFITSAVLQYSQRAVSCDPSQSLSDFGEEYLEQIILSVIKKYPQFAASGSESCNTPKASKGESEASLDRWDDSSALAAISNTLAAFRQD